MHNGAMAGPRIAVVLGAGGAVGHAFHAGVLAAVDQELGWDAARADLVVGTSAGSIVAALLRAGMPAADLARRAHDEPLSPVGAAVVATAKLGRPTRPDHRRPGSRQMSSPARLARAVRAPWDVRPGSLAAAVLPEGRVPTAHIAAPLDALYGDTWPSRPMWIVAVELDSGRRVVFGRDGSPVATPAEAVRASCAIPAYFEPPVIDGQRYVDGGLHSTTNADLVAEEAPDLVLVCAPMSAVRGATPRFGPRVPIRQFARLSLSREVAALRGRGIPVVAFQPTAADLAVMSGDSLDPTKLAPVCAQVFETTCQRLSRPDVRERLAALDR
jgi:NTE family protein